MDVPFVFVAPPTKEKRLIKCAVKRNGKEKFTHICGACSLRIVKPVENYACGKCGAVVKKVMVLTPCNPFAGLRRLTEKNTKRVAK